MKITIDGRTYPFPAVDTLTFREGALLQRIAGRGMAEIGAAAEAGDTNVIVAMALIAMRRSGQPVEEDYVLDLPIRAIVVDTEDQEASNGGPPDATANGDAPVPESRTPRARSGSRS